MFTKMLKFAFGACGLWLFYFLVINPCACSHSPHQLTKLKARQLYVELERLQADGQNPWPLAAGAVAADPRSQQAGVYTNAVSYFNWLYRMDEYGTDGWEPRVAGMPLLLVTNDDAAKSFTTDNVMWSIAEGVNDQTPDCVPVLVSANLDCSLMVSSYDGSENFPLTTTDGRPAIIVNKKGAVSVLKPKYLKASNLYWRYSFSNGPKSYLTPKGRVWTRGGSDDLELREE